jgi:hypothetical protein
MNQVQRSPLNQYKGVGMELFGIPQKLFKQQEFSNYSNKLGNVGEVDTEQLVNFVSQTASPLLEALSRRAGRNGGNQSSLLNSQPKLILGKSQVPNLIGSSRALEVMHSSLIGNGAGRVFQAYIRQDDSNENVQGLNMLTIVSQQLRFSENMGTSKLPGTTFINDLLLTDAESMNNNMANSNPDVNESNGQSGGRVKRGILGDAQNAVRSVGNLLTNANDAFRSTEVRSALERLGRNPQSFNVTNQITLRDGRWSVKQETVKIIEDSLESTYVPFYFQDLRTNEILSFHAFLKTAKTSFSPKWKKNSFIGRVDDVGTYEGSTERTVQVEFSVFATNPQDFGIMYDKINRFLGFVYPQYDEGIKLETEFDNIGFMRNLNSPSGDSVTKPVIPFSQRQIASPLIRMRIGDIIKSAAYDDNDSSMPRINPRAENYLGIRDLIINNNAEANEEGNALNTQGQLVTDEIQALNDAIQLDLIQAGFQTINGQAVASLTFVNNNNEITIPPEFNGPSITSVSISGNEFNNSSEELSSILNERTNQINQIISQRVSTLRERISSYNNSVSEYLNRLSSQEFANTVNRGNAVIRRAFEQIGGRGLAGYINSSIDIDLNEYPWETEKGLRAPMGFDISFTFSVIHDVPPGLNYRGEMRPIFWPKKPINYDISSQLYDPVTPSFTGIGDISNGDPLVAQPFAQPERPRNSGGIRSAGAYVLDFTLRENSRTKLPDSPLGFAAPTQITESDISDIRIISLYQDGQRDPFSGARRVRVDGITGIFNITGEQSVGSSVFSTTEVGLVDSQGASVYQGPNAEQVQNRNLRSTIYLAVPEQNIGNAAPGQFRGRRVRRI